jgi:tRNA threonylcarbamoyladenosine biosynthesis protein TsaE
VSVTSRSEAETEAVAEGLGRSLTGGEVVLLFGDLGAGKTAFVRGLARGLGIDAEEVHSPTFVLLTAYPGGRLVLHHADLYRLSGPRDREAIPPDESHPIHSGATSDERELGLEELPGNGGVLAVEWAERLADEPWSRRIHVRLAHGGEDVRTIAIERVGA